MGLNLLLWNHSDAFDNGGGDRVLGYNVVCTAISFQFQRITRHKSAAKMTGISDDSPAVLKSDSTAATTTTITNNGSGADNADTSGKIKDCSIEVVPQTNGNGDDAAQQAEPSAEAAAENAKSERDEKYNQFKRDPEKMQQMDEFVNGLLETAEKEAEIRMAAKKVLIVIGLGIRRVCRQS